MGSDNFSWHHPCPPIFLLIICPTIKMYPLPNILRTPVSLTQWYFSYVESDSQNQGGKFVVICYFLILWLLFAKKSLSES